jgi:hypothetical protein
MDTSVSTKLIASIFRVQISQAGKVADYKEREGKKNRNGSEII